MLVAEVRKGAQRRNLAPEDITRGVRAGEIVGTDWISDGVVAPCPVAAHPDYRSMFLPGMLQVPVEDLTPGFVVRARRVVSWAVQAAALALLTAVATGALAVAAVGPEEVAYRVLVRLDAERAREDLSSEARALLRGEAPEEPRATLLADAWRAWGEGSPEGLARAVDFARRASVRAPDDAESWGTLAYFLSVERGSERLRVSAATRAQVLDPSASAVQLAAGGEHLAHGDLFRAMAHARACLAAAPAMLPCRELALESEPDARETAARRMAEFDALAAQWPANLRLRAHAARLAVLIDAPTAERRLAEARALMPDDVPLRVAEAQLRYRDGEVDAGRDLVATVAPGINPAVVLGEAEAALQEANPQQALAALAALSGGQSPDLGEEIALRRVGAQARVLLAGVGGPGVRQRRQEALAAVEHLMELDAVAASTVQVAMLLAEIEGRPADGDRAWSRLDTRASSRRDVARVWATRSVVLLSRQDLSGARIAATDAVHADGTEVAPHVVRMVVSSLTRDVGALEAASRDVARLPDLRQARRLPQGGATEVEPPWGEANRAVAAFARLAPAPVGLATAVARADAALDILRGRAATATGLQGSEAVDFALRARGYQRTNQPRAAVRAAQQAVALEPGEAHWRLLLAETSVQDQDWKQAVDALMAARRLGLGDDAYVDALEAEAASALGQEARLHEAARRAVAADPLDVATRKLLRRGQVQ